MRVHTCDFILIVQTLCQYEQIPEKNKLNNEMFFWGVVCSLGMLACQLIFYFGSELWEVQSMVDRLHCFWVAERYHD